MSVTFGFYNSVTGDRTYDATQISNLFDGIIKDGVFAGIGSNMMVVAGTGLYVNVGIGRAWFNHTWTYNDASLPLAIEVPDEFYPRIDAVVLEVNDNNEVRTNTLKVLKGEAAASPHHPTLSNTGGVYQHPLAYVNVPVGVSQILQAHITNQVGSTDCPFVTGPLSVITLNALVAQWQSEFDEWFDNLVNELDTEQETHLQNEIDGINLMALKIIERQGGSATDWNLGGATNYDLSDVKTKIQVGNAFATDGVGHCVVTFPTPFLHKPIVIPVYDGLATHYTTLQVVSVTTTGFVGLFVTHLTAAPYHGVGSNISTCNWMAFGEVA